MMNAMHNGEPFITKVGLLGAGKDDKRLPTPGEGGVRTHEVDGDGLDAAPRLSSRQRVEEGAHLRLARARVQGCHLHDAGATLHFFDLLHRRLGCAAPHAGGAGGRALSARRLAWPPLLAQPSVQVGLEVLAARNLLVGDHVNSVAL